MTVGGGATCPLCGAAVTGQFCDSCGFRASARRPYAPLGGPAGSSSDTRTGLAEPTAAASSSPPESLFPPVSRPEPAFSAWSRPKPSSTPPGPSVSSTAPSAVAAKPETPEDAGVVDLLASLFAPAAPVSPPSPVSPPLPVSDEPLAPAKPPAAPHASPEPPTSPSLPAVPPVRTAPAFRPASSAPPTTPIPSLTGVTWTVLVASDRVYYDRMQTARGRSSAVEFPAHTSERRIRLVGKQMRIGRRSPARDLVPEIDLADRPVDPGISRLHAVLTPAPDGTWSILDPGSANGTLVNGRELTIGEMVTLHEGDRINLGAWTVITVHRG